MLTWLPGTGVHVSLRYGPELLAAAPAVAGGGGGGRSVWLRGRRFVAGMGCAYSGEPRNAIIYLYWVCRLLRLFRGQTRLPTCLKQRKSLRAVTVQAWRLPLCGRHGLRPHSGEPQLLGRYFGIHIYEWLLNGHGHGRLVMGSADSVVQRVRTEDGG